MGKDGREVGLNIEEMKYSNKLFDSYVQGRMKELGIDFSSGEYIRDPKFKQLSKSFVKEGNEFVTEAWWIEKILLGNSD